MDDNDPNNIELDAISVDIPSVKSSTSPAPSAKEISSLEELRIRKYAKRRLRFIIALVLPLIGQFFYGKSLLKGPLEKPKHEPWVLSHLYYLFIYDFIGSLFFYISLGVGLFAFKGRERKILTAWNVFLIAFEVYVGGFNKFIQDHGLFNLVLLVLLGIVFGFVYSIMGIIRCFKLKAWHVLAGFATVALLMAPGIISGAVKWPKGLMNDKLVFSSQGCTINRPWIDWEMFVNGFKQTAIRSWALKPCYRPPMFAYIDETTQEFVIECPEGTEAGYTLLPFTRINLSDPQYTYPGLLNMTEQYLYVHNHEKSYKYTGRVPKSEWQEASAITAYCGDEKKVVIPPFQLNTTLLEESEAAAQATGKRPRVSIVMIYLDAVSRPAMHRSLPKSMKFLESLAQDPKSPASVHQFLRAHSYVHNTAPNSRGMFTGTQYTSTKPYLWESLKEAGYITMIVDNTCVEWAVKYGGRSSQPDIAPNAIWCHDDYTIVTDDDYNFVKGTSSIVRRCLLGNQTDELGFQFQKNFERTYRDQSRFSLLKFTEGHEISTSVIMTVDDGLEDYLRSVDFNSTVVMLLSDHGNHMGFLLKAFYSFYVESYLPGLFLITPKWLLTEENRKALEHNTQALVTPADFHATIMDIALNGYPAEKRSDEELSLVSDNIPYTRDCESAQIPDIYCQCH